MYQMDWNGALTIAVDRLIEFAGEHPPMEACDFGTESKTALQDIKMLLQAEYEAGDDGKQISKGQLLVFRNIMEKIKEVLP